MEQMKQFLNMYLPQYFVYKLRECSLKEYFFDYRVEGNVFEFSQKLFTLIDKLQQANPSFKSTQIVDKYFIFLLLDFDKKCKDVKNSLTQEKCQVRQLVRKIMKKMELKVRMCFQIFIRLIYVYFDCKEHKTKNQNDQKFIQYYDQIIMFYMDLKMESMLQQGWFVPMDFVQHAILLLLKMKPNQNFMNLILKLTNQLQFTQHYQQRIKQKITTMKKELLLKLTHIPQKNILKPKTLKNELKNNQNILASQQTKNSIQQSSKQIKQNQLTPVKNKSENKKQRATHESSQKKDKMISIKGEDKDSLESLKKTLQMHKQQQLTSSSKQRTLYSRKKYVITTKIQPINDQLSSTGSNPNNQQDFCLIDLGGARSYSARYIQINQNNDQDFLVGATPKPKKKVKLQKSHSFTFDQNGNSVISQLRRLC